MYPPHSGRFKFFPWYWTEPKSTEIEAFECENDNRSTATIVPQQKSLKFTRFQGFITSAYAYFA